VHMRVLFPCSQRCSAVSAATYLATGEIDRFAQPQDFCCVPRTSRLGLKRQLRS
jgi:hypothetical protein